jgi:hypothetical protein
MAEAKAELPLPPPGIASDQASAQTKVETAATPEKTSLENNTDAPTGAPPSETGHDEASGSPAADNDDDELDHVTGLKLYLIIIALCLCVFLVALDQTIIAPALGAITAEFKSVKDIVSCLGVSIYPSTVAT